MLGTSANPHNPKRMELFLKDLEKIEKDQEFEDQNFVEVHEDEVTVNFYGAICSCSNRSTCSTKSCECVKSDLKCSSLCHKDNSKCKNINSQL